MILHKRLVLCEFRFFYVLTKWQPRFVDQLHLDVSYYIMIYSSGKSL
jgi:hypothetical protein